MITFPLLLPGETTYPGGKAGAVTEMSARYVYVVQLLLHGAAATGVDEIAAATSTAVAATIRPSQRLRIMP